MRLVVGIAVAYVAVELGLRASVRAGYGRGFRAGHDRAVGWMLEHACEPAGWNPNNEWVWSA